jgi:hypothetical protein
LLASIATDKDCILFRYEEEGLAKGRFRLMH